MDGEELRRVVEGQLWEDSAGTKYEPGSEDEAGSDSELSLESERSVYEGRRLHSRGEKGRSGSADGEGSSGGPCRSRGRQSKFKVKARIGSGETQHPVAAMEGSDVVLRSRCTIKKLAGLNAIITVRHREAVTATVLRPFLEYPDIGMERHLTLALIKCWVPRWKAFRLGGGGKGAILRI